MAAYRHGWHRQNWHDAAAREYRAIRETVGLYDVTSFGKIRIDGADAEAVLNHACGADMSVEPGRIVDTQMLNSNGGIDADVTVARLTWDAFLLVTPAATCIADLARLRRFGGDRRVTLTDASSGEAVLAVMGLRAREWMQSVFPDDFGNAAHPFGTVRHIEVGMALARAHRFSCVCELGWELYVPTEFAAHVFETLEEAGADVGLRLYGLHSMDSCRLEQRFRRFGHDVTSEDHVIEAGLGFAGPRAKAG